ncbi:hypothetical protein [Pseudomonas putida]|uniref:hypothetical protein n=1 Tax=Pseudomonas putida TaxID=303 RepID=UPI0023641EB6|nr:hypothetical protein [Pseudomonas putida]MDD2145836.1 hypothetical protein [Pseudomonas putida]HDS1705410.1 hypothetical protein [Pseudomonas putida]
MKSLRRHRDRLPILGCWPQQWIKDDSVWHMFELQLKPDGNIAWYLRRDDVAHGGYGSITYRDYDAAVSEAKSTNILLRHALKNLGLPFEQVESIRLKVRKALTAEERLMTEERLMLTEAIKRHKAAPRPRLEDLTVLDGSDVLKAELHKCLLQHPYVQLVFLARYGMRLQCEGNLTWRAIGANSHRVALHAHREKTARGFGMSGTDHWGQTKAAIRDALLPRANKLLHLASVKLLLADALRRGQRVLILGSFVFWYENGNTPQWVVKQVGASGKSETGETIWLEGTILSKNHGRIVVLPYIKENGERVQGHTKNAPHDGKALPRHRSAYVELPFEVLSGDLMYSLFGELNYE